MHLYHSHLAGIRNPRIRGQYTYEALDLNVRPAEDYIWQRHPWRLTFSGDPKRLFAGVDYLFAYWLGRHQGFIDDGAVNTCLRWRDPA